MTKEDFFEKLNPILSKEEIWDIRETCAEMDTYLRKDNEDINYQSLYDLFQTSESSFAEFKVQLGNRLDVLRYRDFICKRRFMKDQAIGACQQDVLLAVDNWCKKNWNNLTPEKQNDLIISITDGVCRFVILSKRIDEDFQILKDKIVLKKLSQFDTICFNNKKEKIGCVKSKPMIDLIRTEFTQYIKSRRLLQATLPELEDKLKRLGAMRKKCLHYTIRSIADILAEYDLLDKATKPNNYNLKNKEGVLLSLGNKKAEKIYSLVDDLDFNVTYYAGRKSPSNQSEDIIYKLPESSKEKIDYVKDRLVDLPQIDVNQLLEDYQGLIL